LYERKCGHYGVDPVSLTEGSSHLAEGRIFCQV
jgi:hypothetical protein